MVFVLAGPYSLWWFLRLSSDRSRAMAFIYHILHILTPSSSGSRYHGSEYILYCSVRQQRVKNQSLVCCIIHSPEPVFVNVYGAQESILRNRIRSLPIRKNRVVPARQAVNRFLASLKGLQIKAQFTQQSVYESVRIVRGNHAPDAVFT